jgi:hypothetical protein
MLAGQTVIKRCSCKSEYQDSKYGKGMRVHTTGVKKDGMVPERCTVCGPQPKSESRLVTHGMMHNRKIHG